nr:RNA polymerase recycling motor ATPase HelR [Propionicimonas sp.]
MTPVATDIFTLPERLAAKTDAALIGADVAHFAAVAGCLDQRVADLTARLDELRRAPGRRGRGALDRDLEIHRLSAQLRLLRRFGLDVCLGRMVQAGEDEPVYVGRIGLAARDGRQLLLDWRTPAAEPYFAATQARPMGLTSRRRYRWVDGRIRDYWDEVLVPGDGHEHLALDENSAFIASLGTSRSSRMRDVLATIQADQDAIVRAGSHGALVVDGGPGTGKTVVALHRAAYLLYADPRLSGRGGGLLFVGPHQPYLAYVSDVLPSLDEEGVLTCTLRDLVPEGATAVPEPDPEVAGLKASAELLRAVGPAVGLYEEPPATGMTVETEWGEVWLSAADWAEAFEAPDPGTPHNEARILVWESLLDILVDSFGNPDVPVEQLRRALSQHEELWDTFRRAWPILEAPELVADLWAVPAYLRRCAPWLSPEEVRALRRPEGSPWTVADLPLLDAMRQRLGDPEAFGRERRRALAVEADRAYMDTVVDDLLTANDDPESPLPLLRRESLRTALVDEAGLPSADRDLLAGPFAHIIVDEAQELTDAEWQQLLSRCPSRSFTIVGDRAQARRGFTESWQERLKRLGFDRITRSTLTINYRTPEEIMTEAGPIIRAVLPDADLPTSIRRSGLPVRYGSRSELDAILDRWLAGNPEGTACVIGDSGFAGSDRVRSLTPETAKGLEFDLVILVDPDRMGTGVEAAVDRYVAMTRTTQQLVALTG